MMCVYIVDPRWFKPAFFQSRHMGQYRWRFLLQSLQDLQQQLQALGQNLQLFYAQPLELLPALIEQHQINIVGTGKHCGVYENQQWQKLRQMFPQTTFHQGEGFSLFQQQQLPFTVDDLPASFSQFRKQVETYDINITPPEQQIRQLPVPLAANVFTQQLKQLPLGIKNLHYGFTGGGKAGEQHLQQYLFDNLAVRHYKQTRNALDGWSNSSKLSPWLANGSLSVRYVFQQLKQHEQQYGANESSYWLYFELLWREYFYWYASKFQSDLFKFGGIKQQSPTTSFWPQRFARWCQGDTPYPLVNACMRQLNQTGFMSNRGRQIVASCLVNELQLDWRFGAAYFEQQLIDFDVGSNWGNWQYLAGVGADPRSKRWFDLTKQTQQFDPQGEFIGHWCGQHQVDPVLDHTDMSDWPIKNE